ncbi:hypothetical protein [Robertmurraya siralis]|nr:hypothetical protein [Robertmurraya siralis]
MVLSETYLSTPPFYLLNVLTTRIETDKYITSLKKGELIEIGST